MHHDSFDGRPWLSFTIHVEMAFAPGFVCILPLGDVLGSWPSKARTLSEDRLKIGHIYLSSSYVGDQDLTPGSVRELIRTRKSSKSDCLFSCRVVRAKECPCNVHRPTPREHTKFSEGNPQFIMGRAPSKIGGPRTKSSGVHNLFAA